MAKRYRSNQMPKKKARSSVSKARNKSARVISKTSGLGKPEEI